MMQTYPNQLEVDEYFTRICSKAENFLIEAISKKGV